MSRKFIYRRSVAAELFFFDGDIGARKEKPAATKRVAIRAGHLIGRQERQAAGECADRH